MKVARVACLQIALQVSTNSTTSASPIETRYVPIGILEYKWHLNRKEPQQNEQILVLL